MNTFTPSLASGNALNLHVLSRAAPRLSVHYSLMDTCRTVIGENGSLIQGPLSAPIILGGRVFEGRTVHFETQVVLR
jgi:hypothetical protein